MSNPGWTMYLMERVLIDCMDNPERVMQYKAIAEAGAVFAGLAAELHPCSREMVRDILSKPRKQWVERWDTWCAPENYKSWLAWRREH